MTSANGLAILLDFWILFVLVTVLIIPVLMIVSQLALLLLGTVLSGIFRGSSKIADYLLKKSGFG